MRPWLLRVGGVSSRLCTLIYSSHPGTSTCSPTPLVWAQVLNKSGKAVIHSLHVFIDISGYMSIPTNASFSTKKIKMWVDSDPAFKIYRFEIKQIKLLYLNKHFSQLSSWTASLLIWVSHQQSGPLHELMGEVSEGDVPALPGERCVSLWLMMGESSLDHLRSSFRY